MNTFLLLVLLLLPILTHTQIPAVCSDPDSLRDSICCPDTTDGICGSDAGRGQCVSLSLTDYDPSSSDVRENWPHYYTQMCECNENYGGIDCTRCKLGYYGNGCTQKQVIPRREAGSFSDSDWGELSKVLRLTRDYDSGYKVVLQEELPGTENLETTNISLYGLYVWVHHYAAKDSLDSSIVPPKDYAHSAPGFTTWHRYHTLWLEWQIQGMLEEMGESDYHTFRFPYWDWRTEIQHSSGISSNELFTEGRMGATYNDNGFPRVNGSIVAGGWDTICWLTFFTTCDPRNSTGPLQRCPFTGTNPCDSSNPDWPTMAQVNVALGEDNYDTPPYNTFSVDGYRALVDFKIFSLSPSECAEDRMCQCIPGFDPSCSSALGITFQANMHSKIHFILGIGDLSSNQNLQPQEKGQLEDVAASPNDPMFILHHLTIDCMFEEWMQTHPDGYYPSIPLQNPGHKKGDYMVPFYPLYTHGEMFVSGSEFGISCNLPNVTAAATTFSHLGLWLVFSLIVFVLLI